MTFDEVTRDAPCPICGKPDYCCRSEDGVWISCYRYDDGVTETKTDSRHIPYWVYRTDGQTVTRGNSASLKAPTVQSATLADVDRRHTVYNAFARLTILSRKHEDSLLARGLSAAVIDRNQYRTMPLTTNRGEICYSLRQEFGNLDGVPGFGIGDYGSLTLFGRAGIWIPVRDVQGRIQAAMIRQDEEPDDPKKSRYKWFSSYLGKKFQGPSPGSPSHVPFMTMDAME